MEHLWLDHEHQRPLDQVRVLGLVGYDYHGFSGFLARLNNTAVKVRDTGFQYSEELAHLNYIRNVNTRQVVPYAKLVSTNDKTVEENLNGFPGDEAARTEHGPNDRRYMLSEAQEWLFFGLCIDVFDELGMKIRREHLISTSEGRQSLSTQHLLNMFRVTLGAWPKSHSTSAPSYAEKR